MSVPAGYTLRTSTEDDLEQVMALHTRRSGAFDAEDFGFVHTDPDAGPDWTAVVEADGTRRVVAALSLLEETVRIGTIDVPAGQIELVATDSDHEGRGLSRALVEWAHAESARRGHLLQPMVGIPNFYRQFGYVYAVPVGQWCRLACSLGAPPADLDIRPAELGDEHALAELNASEQARADVAKNNTLACWRWIIRRQGTVTLIARRDGRAVASCRTLPPDEGHALGELAAADEDAARGLLAHVAATQPDVIVHHRPTTVGGRAIADLLAQPDEPDHQHWFYVRVPDLVALLNHLLPELQRRLDAAAPVDLPDELLISSYRSHVRAPIVDGTLGPFRSGGALQAPVSAGGSGIPLDVWPAALVGPYGGLELERRHPDVLLGRQRALMAALFPPMHADLQMFYLPV